MPCRAWWFEEQTNFHQLQCGTQGGLSRTETPCATQGEVGIIAHLGSLIWQPPMLVKRPHIEMGIFYLFSPLLSCTLEGQTMQQTSGIFFFFIFFYSRVEVDSDQIEKHSKRISWAVSPQGSGPDCCSSIQSHTLYTQQNSHSRWFDAGRIKLCCRCKAPSVLERVLECHNQLMLSLHLHVGGLIKELMFWCNDTISELLSTPLKRQLNIK